MTHLPALTADPTLRLEPIPEPLSWGRRRRTLVPTDPFDREWALEVERAQPELDPTEPAVPRIVGEPVEVMVECAEDLPELVDTWFDEDDCTLAPALPRDSVDADLDEVDALIRNRRSQRLAARVLAAVIVGLGIGIITLYGSTDADAEAPEPLPELVEPAPVRSTTHLVIEAGDTFAGLVGDRADAMLLVAAAAPLADLNLIEVGRTLVLAEEDGSLVEVRYPVDELHTLSLARIEGGWLASHE